LCGHYPLKNTWKFCVVAVDLLRLFDCFVSLALLLLLLLMRLSCCVLVLVFFRVFWDLFSLVEVEGMGLCREE
jgi:hypothetical protein